MCKNTSTQISDTFEIARYHLSYRQPRSGGFTDRHLWLPVRTVNAARTEGNQRNLISLFVTNALGFVPETVAWQQRELVPLTIPAPVNITLAL